MHFRPPLPEACRAQRFISTSAYCLFVWAAIRRQRAPSKKSHARRRWPGWLITTSAWSRLAKVMTKRRPAGFRWSSKQPRRRLRDLAAAQLGDLTPPPPDRNWLGYASVGAGYDDNVALVSNSEVLGISGTEDSFAEAQLAISAPLTQPWRFDAGLSYSITRTWTASINWRERRRALSLGARRLEARRRPATRLRMLDGEGFEHGARCCYKRRPHVLGDWRVYGCAIASTISMAWATSTA